MTVAKYLLRNNANPLLKSSIGQSALHLATSDDTPLEMSGLIELLVSKEAEWSTQARRVRHRIQAVDSQGSETPRGVRFSEHKVNRKARVLGEDKRMQTSRLRVSLR